jgi:hypothetical protein
VAKKTRAPKKSYAVGYCKPPTHNRWQEGQSGNVTGRPRDARPEPPAGLDPISAAILGVMSEPVSVVVGRRRRCVSGTEGVVRAVRDQILAGDTRHARMLLDFTAEAQERAAALARMNTPQDDAAQDAFRLMLEVWRTARIHGGSGPEAYAQTIRRAAEAMHAFAPIHGDDAGEEGARGSAAPSGGGEAPQGEARPDADCAARPEREAYAGREHARSQASPHPRPTPSPRRAEAAPRPPAASAAPEKSAEVVRRTLHPGDPLIRDRQPLCGGDLGIGGRRDPPTRGIFD